MLFTVFVLNRYPFKRDECEMKKYLLIIFSVLMVISFMQGCSDDDGAQSGYIEITVSGPAVSALDTNNRHDVSYYLINVYSVNNTEKPVVSPTRIDPPETSAMIFGLPLGEGELREPTFSLWAYMA